MSKRATTFHRHCRECHSRWWICAMWLLRGWHDAHGCELRTWGSPRAPSSTRPLPFPGCQARETEPLLPTDSSQHTGCGANFWVVLVPGTRPHAVLTLNCGALLFQLSVIVTLPLMLCELAGFPNGAPAFQAVWVYNFPITGCEALSALKIKGETSVQTLLRAQVHTRCLEEGLQQTLILLCLRTTGQVQVHCSMEPYS